MIRKETHEKVKELLSNQLVKHSNADINFIIDLSESYIKQGYDISPIEIVEFLNQIKNQEMIQEKGLTQTLRAMSMMKLSSIQNPNKTGRNEICPKCDSGKKYKKCCLNKK